MLRYRQYQAVNIMVPLQDPRDVLFSVVCSHVQSKYRCARDDRIGKVRKSCRECAPVSQSRISITVHGCVHGIDLA